MNNTGNRKRQSRFYQWGHFCHSVMVDGWKIAIRQWREQRQTWETMEERTLQNVLSSAERIHQEQSIFPRKIRFSILVRLQNPDEDRLRKMVQSVERQTYDRWEICLADCSAQSGRVTEELRKAAGRAESRIRYRKMENGANAANQGRAWTAMATGEYYVLLDPEDLLHPSALFFAMQAICKDQADLIYTDDSDYEKESGELVSPRYKPDYAPDSLRGNPYIGRMIVFSRGLVESCGGGFMDALGRMDNYEIMLRLTERAEWIHHIPMSLYFREGREASQEDPEMETRGTIARQALEKHLKRVAMKGTVENSFAPDTYRIRYAIEGEPLVSVIIPNHDHADDLTKCIRSIRDKTTWKKYEILIIENGSQEKETFDLYEHLAQDPQIRVLKWMREFNFSGINNYAAQQAKGRYLLMLNNDTEVISPDWIQEMLMYAQRDDVGAVGAKLYYPDGTIQHAGVGVGLMHSVGHFHRRAGGQEAGYMGRLAYAQNLSAVTGACMMVSRRIYENAGGMDESFPLVFNDVDFCMKLRRAGYLIVWTPFAELLHYESKTRGSDEDSPEKQMFFRKESRRFQNRWNDELTRGDPYYNPNLSLSSEDFARRS